MSSQKVWFGVLFSIVISLAAMGFSTYSVTRSIQAAPIMTSTSISLEEEFNWAVAEIVEVQGNLYAYLGYMRHDAAWRLLRLAKWQDCWIEITYSVIDYPRNVSLSPYILQVSSSPNNNYFTAQFFES